MFRLEHGFFVYVIEFILKSNDRLQNHSPQAVLSLSLVLFFAAGAAIVAASGAVLAVFLVHHQGLEPWTP